MNSAENVSERVKHIKRGTTYTTEAAAFQVSVPDEMPAGVTNHLKGRVVLDGETIITYRDEASGKLYARFPDEFTPDRFQALRSPPTEDADRVEVWGSSTIDRLQRAIMDDDEAVRERAAENVAVLYAHSVAPYAAALAMVRETIGELFGPKASIESEDATLLRGPEPHHEAEAQIAALRRVSASPRPETVGTSEAMVERAQTHAIALEQCSIFVDSPHLKSAMTEAAAFLRSISPQEGE